MPTGKKGRAAETAQLGKKGHCYGKYTAAVEDPSTRGHYTAGGLYAPGVRDTTPTHVPDVDCIAEPRVTSESPSTYGNRSPYNVLGKEYKVMSRVDGYAERGTASYYGNKFHGRKTSNHEVYDMYQFTAAHKTLPLPSFVLVTNLDNDQSVVVRVNDRGPFHDGRVIDLSYAAAVKLGIVQRGTGRVEVRALTPKNAERILAGRKYPAQAATTAIETGVPAAADVRTSTMPSGIDGLVQTLSTDEDETATVSSVGTANAVPNQEITAGNGLGPVVLQVASFSIRANADRAMQQLVEAGIDGASLTDANNHGLTLWRLRVAAADADAAQVLSSRIFNLGLGMPSLVRD